MKKKLKSVLLVDDNDSDNFIHKRVIESGCFLYKPLTLGMLVEIMQKHFQEYL